MADDLSPDDLPQPDFEGTVPVDELHNYYAVGVQ
jgi:hypothetical protein